jgi:hypothetical protein
MKALRALIPLMLLTALSGRRWNGPQFHDSHKPSGGCKTFKMNRRKELAITAKCRAKR